MGSIPDPSVIGVDGSGPGWVAAILGVKELRYLDSLDDLPEAVAIAIDIPLGFPSGKCQVPARARTCGCRRPAEIEAAERLAAAGLRRSLFWTAPRRAYDRVDYEEARAVAKEDHSGEHSISRQSHALRGKILEAEQFLEKRPGTVIEVHPEVVFTTLNKPGGDAAAALAGKQTWRGHLQRCALLTSVDLSPHEFKLNQPTPKTGPGIDRVGPDDVLDAIAAAWVAEKWSRQAATRLGPEARNSDQPMWT